MQVGREESPDGSEMQPSVWRGMEFKVDKMPFLINQAKGNIDLLYIK